MGISAGPDSMALLHMCQQVGMDVVAAHVNYHHRKEADEEESYVRNICTQYNIPLYVLNKPFTYARNFEAEARNWRYDFFCEIVKERQLKGVLIAHHEDDALETFFMQEEKGSIPAFYGLKDAFMYKGMLVKRPLLTYTKQQLMQYCKEHHIQYYIDQTNMDESLTRNRIRHQIVEKLTRLERDMVLKEIQYKNAVRQERKCRVETYIKQNQMSLALYRSLSLEDRLEILRMLIQDVNVGISKAHLLEIDHIVIEKNDFMIRCGKQLIVQNNGYFFLQEISEPYCDTYVDVNQLFNSTGKYYKVVEGKPSVYACTLKDTDFPIKIRNAQKADWIQLRFGKKKVHRFFIDRHIPLYRRLTWPVIENKDGEVIFVSGLGCDIHHFTSNPTCNVVEYTLLEENTYVGKE